LIVVSDTSPVLSLARIGRLDLLRVLYQQVLIPSSVYQELKASSSQPPGQIDFDAVPWLIVATPLDRRRVEELREDLDLGEAEAIVLAMERRADLLLIDERRGRRVAHASGLAITGLLGVVAQAKRSGLIDAARPVLDDLIRIARFWIGPDLYTEVLTQLGEI
jgi:predicted nucleic acid-binding protein